MANERKTEIIVRDYLQKQKYYSDKDIIIEEQQSDNPKIKKLLNTASKKGQGIGYPEFIITSSKYSDLLIVIECKADNKKHESKNIDKYAEYAVDGALLYASYLSKEYDVIAIGVSGQTKRELNISHYLHLKRTTKAETFVSKKILQFDDYFTEYIQDPQKFNEDYKSLLNFSKELNDALHSKKIKESQRSLLISGILIALKNRAFEVSYKEHETAKQLAENVVDTIGNVLLSSKIAKDKIENLKIAFSFIKVHTTLSKDKEFFEELISNIDSKINSFMKTHKYFDTLGQFYIEFLRYANNDKGLGIVLTPPHITTLFTELAEVNKDSIVFDNCTGTSGFLISAMKKMTENAKGDNKKIKNIKRKQIIGIEYQDDIYALAITNMMLHGDGKSNLIQGDSFNINIDIKKKYQPNIGFLNPPYKTEKLDKEELEFLLNNIEALEPNGKCIAILPMSCALAQSGIKLELKKKLLEKHTLEAVLSMPDELFHNSNVGVITCVMIFTAHKPHSSNKKTYLGYYKDDGFVKRKVKGRNDEFNTWHTIKEKWVTSFLNRAEEDGFSVNHVINPEDEWCAEAYMTTDYSKLLQDNFLKTIKKYVIFKGINL